MNGRVCSPGGDLPSSVAVLIIGAGPGGLCAGIELLRAGISDFTILEKADGVGGTWWHNRYPGAECDVESHLYSYSFEPKPDWSKPYAGQAEIRAYIEHVAETYGIKPYCRFGVEVSSARWDEDAAVWRVATSDGRRITARIVISAIGMFNEIATPDIPGLEQFAGDVFHTARWPDGYDITGRRVALIGSAASAVQTAPEIAPIVRHLDVYQRTPQWVLPKRDTPFTKSEIDRFRNEPEAMLAHRKALWTELENTLQFADPQLIADSEAAARKNIEIVEDIDLRRRLTPAWGFGCRRPLLSNAYYPMFNRSNVTLIDVGIQRVESQGIVTTREELRPAETIVLATGFQTTLFLSAIDVTGRDGLHIGEAWREGAQAYLGIVTAGFPNLFMLYGPNTNSNSFITMLELQAGYVIRCIRRLLDERLRWMDVRPSAMTAYNDQLQTDIARFTVWQADCGGYYRVPSGRIVTQFPYTMTQYAKMLSEVDAQNYESAPEAA